MADGGQILDSKKNVTVSGRVSPVNGQYYSGITVELIQVKNNTTEVCGSGVTDNQGYYNFTGRVYYTDGFGKLYVRVGKDHSNSIDLDKIGLEFTVDDSFETYSNTPFTTDNLIIVDYDDGSTLDTYSTGKLSHTYASSGNYDVKLYGSITGISDNAFRNCTSLISITIPEGVTSIGGSCFRGTHLESISIPESVTSLGDSCFDQCSHLMYIHLNWDSADTIVNYNSTWLGNTTANFYIPKDTTSLYIAKGYPSNKLIEDYVPFDDITVSSDKDILSYADGDSATVSAQLMSEGQPVSISDEVVVFEFVKASDDSVVVTLMGTTDNTGLASVSYLGNGVGDLNITCRCRSVIEIYDTVEDCTKYISNVSSTTSYNIDLPSSFKVSAIINPVSRSSATASVHIGTDANNKMFVGQTGSDGIMNLLKRYNGSYVQNRFNSLSALNTDNYIECEYNNGVYTCKFNNETITDTTGNITPSKLLTIETNTNITIKDIKIKPL